MRALKAETFLISDQEGVISEKSADNESQQKLLKETSTDNTES